MQKMENNKLAVAISATKWVLPVWNLVPWPIGGKVRIGRLFLRQSWTLPLTLLMDMKEPSF